MKNIHIARKQTRTLSQVPNDLLREKVYPYLTRREQLFFSTTDQTILKAYKKERDQALTNLFLEYVMHDNQDAVQNILEASPQMLQKTGRATDPAHRTFEITAFRYALWAKNAVMCSLMLNSLTKDVESITIREDLLRQIDVQTTEGCDYQDAHGKIVQNEKHYNLTTLMDAYHRCTSSYLNEDNRKHLWCTVVGGAQKTLPVNIITAIYTPNPNYRMQKIQLGERVYITKMYFTTPREKQLAKLRFYDNTTMTYRFWFDTNDTSHELGRDFALLRMRPSNYIDRVETLVSIDPYRARAILNEITQHNEQQDTYISDLSARVRRDLLAAFEPEVTSSSSCLIS